MLSRNISIPDFYVFHVMPVDFDVVFDYWVEFLFINQIPDKLSEYSAMFIENCPRK